MATHSRSSRHQGVPELAEDHAFYQRHGFIRVPQLVQWMATLRCSLDCAHCLARGHATHPQEDMSLEATLRLVDQVADMGVQEFLITGGEPLLREDLAQVLERLAQRGVSYSLNTAVMPSTSLQAAFRQHPPAFVAVSVDGPPEVHDGFRKRRGAFAEAMQSLEFFACLPGCITAAGTTVTTANYASLAETFHLVAGSAAGHWGIHLLVPEGRAGERPDLFLSRRQIRELVRFVARKRTYFPVRMADELGYCGDLEPLLRDHPFRCGAGRSQCVVLPSGDVVPCTTLDRSVSAGNLHERELSDIWWNGFTALRAYQPEGRCRECDHAPACGGGCWLQRRRGTQCHKDVWSGSDILRNTAGLAVCLGLWAAATPPATAQAPAPAPAPARVAQAPAMVERPTADRELAAGIERYIVAWYADQVGTRLERVADSGPLVGEPEATLCHDPAYRFLSDMEAGRLPTDLDALAARVREGLGTRQRSLSFVALLWRALGEWCLVNPPEGRSAEQDRVLRDALDAVRKAGTRWHREIVERRLDPYLVRNRVPLRYTFQMVKALVHPPAWLDLTWRMQRERWGVPTRDDPQAVTAVNGFLDLHPYAASMRLGLSCRGKVTRLRDGMREPLAGESFFEVFDVLVGERGSQSVVRILSSGEAEKPGKRVAWDVRLPAGRPCTYLDVLRLLHLQHAQELDPLVASGRLSEALVLFGAVRASLAGPPRADGTGRFPLRLWMADFWMF